MVNRRASHRHTGRRSGGRCANAVGLRCARHGLAEKQVGQTRAPGPLARSQRRGSRAIAGHWRSLGPQTGAMLVLVRLNFLSVQALVGAVSDREHGRPQTIALSDQSCAQQ